MENLFYSFWWLLFPLAWVLLSAWRSWLRYQTHRDHLDVMRTYAARGKSPPSGLGDPAQGG
jgi:hypothetical protein